MTTKKSSAKKKPTMQDIFNELVDRLDLLPRNREYDEQ